MLKKMKFTFCKKQYIYLALALISLSLALVSRVSAETTTPADQNTPVTEVADDSAPQEEETIKPLLPAPVQERILNLCDNVINKMRSVSKRFLNIAERLESRINKQKESGQDTTEAEKNLEIAKNYLNVAYVTTGSLHDTVQVMLASKDPSASFGKLRTDFMGVRESLRESHHFLRMTVASLKSAADKTSEDTGSSTPQQ